MTPFSLRQLLVLCTALCTIACADARAAREPQHVVVQDPYVDLRTGPGRGFPASYSAARGTSVELVRRRTDWIKVRTAGGRAGWVHRDQLQRTLMPDGAEVSIAGPEPDARTRHRWEVGLATGDFGGANAVGVRGAWALTPGLFVRGDAAQLLGDHSDGWLGTLGIAHVFVPEWRIAPYVGLGGGLLDVSPKATLVAPEDRTDATAYAGVGVRGFLTRRFFLQAEYRSYVVFTNRDDNEEIDEWTVGFAYYF